MSRFTCWKPPGNHFIQVFGQVFRDMPAIGYMLGVGKSRCNSGSKLAFPDPAPRWWWSGSVSASGWPSAVSDQEAKQSASSAPDPRLELHSVDRASRPTRRGQWSAEQRWEGGEGHAWGARSSVRSPADPADGRCVRRLLRPVPDQVARGTRADRR